MTKVETHTQVVSSDIDYNRLLTGSTKDFIPCHGVDLIGRWKDHHAWMNDRLNAGLDPYDKYTKVAIGPTIQASTRDGASIHGVNFASQDYLSLSNHHEIREAAKEAINQYGVHSAGSVALMGSTILSRNLEAQLSDFLDYDHCAVFPTGWSAGFGAVRTLCGVDDHIVMDVLAHSCLQEGARAAGSKIHLHAHLSCEAVERTLRKIRRDHPQAGILVVTESLFSMDSDTPDIKLISSICKKYSATLLLDIAHDFGSIGVKGLGFLELQDAVGTPDILIGSFSKTFASNGGFVACKEPALKLAFKFQCPSLTFTNALSPVQCAIVTKAIQIARSDEGARRRVKLAANVSRLRAGLKDVGFEVLGVASAIVPALIGNAAISRLATKSALNAGAIVNLVEYPGVPKNLCRWRLQVMADHSFEEIDKFIEIAMTSRTESSNSAKAFGF